jgi:hypothetical protein
MPLTIEGVEAALTPQGLRNPVLPFLSRDPAMIRVLMLQPEGIILATEQAVRVQDRPRATMQMKGFLQKAADANVDIATCPEYSCPWDAIMETVNAGLFPAAGKLWALGCESATPQELTAVLMHLQPTLQIVFDRTVLQQNGDFVDLLCYLFRTHRLTDGAEVCVALLQPKTTPMGGHPFEQLHLKTGNRLYRFTNSSAPSNHLVSLICSDTLHPDFHQITPQLQTDTLVLHLQLNTNPSSPAFCQYRSACCVNKPRSTEILCLNWARGTRIPDPTHPLKITEPKTILFRDKEEVLVDDSHIAANHSKGCYLTNWQTHRTAAFVFSPDPHLFYFETTKPSMVGPAAAATRTGPHMRQLFAWENDNWQPATANDRFKSYWFDPYPALQQLEAEMLPKHLLAERLIQLSIGYARTMEWAVWSNLKSFELADDDTAQRLTLCWSDSGTGLTFRERCLSLFRGFMGAVGTSTQFSSRLDAFKTAAFTIEYRPTPLFNGFRNLHLGSSGASATGIYLGEAPSRRELSEVKKRTMEGLYETRSDTQLLAIWYRDPQGKLHDFMDEDIPKITEDPDEGPVAIDNMQP